MRTPVIFLNIKQFKGSSAGKIKKKNKRKDLRKESNIVN